MSTPGDRLTVPTPNGPLSLERTPMGVRAHSPQGGSIEMSVGQARQVAEAINTLARGPSFQPQGQGQSGQQSQGWGQQGGQQQGGSYYNQQPR